jgi:hypothetical protein
VNAGRLQEGSRPSLQRTHQRTCRRSAHFDRSARQLAGRRDDHESISDVVAWALNLDQLDQLELLPPSGDSAAAIVASTRQVGDRLFIGLNEDFGHDTASVLSCEYHFAEAPRLVTSVAHGTQQPCGGRRLDSNGLDFVNVIRR